MGFVFPILTNAQSSTYVDNKGVLRWAENKKEVCVFGTNYAVPFAYWEARADLVKNNHKKAIDEDVYHLTRLGLDGFRIHVMESYISDEKGNLLDNIHLQLFDYLLFKLKERGIKLFITPMYLQGGKNSFAQKYGKNVGCLSNKQAFVAQQNYLKQFMNHVNPYTNIAYKNDADIIAFEIVNEPKHYKAPNLVVNYINTMCNAIKSTGCDKPLFYNMTTSFSVIDKVLKSNTDGGTFQWYPTGLTANQTLKGNFLPNVDKYIIPFENELKKQHKPKFIYEFSPADTKGAYMYPAMARSFREAGFQFAAHFSYDPLHEAHSNVEYKTHFLNLAYTPKKAIGLMIANEVFHKTPLYKSYGRFPKNNTFDGCVLNYEQNLALYNNGEKYINSNSTTIKPKNTNTLKQIAGVGNSPLVVYEGNGAYFLDKVDDGVWRLEVMPDAHWVKDPFFVPYTNGECAVILNREHKLILNLQDLGLDFTIKTLNTKNNFKAKCEGRKLTIRPGTYLLAKKGKTTKLDDDLVVNRLKLTEFYTSDRKIKKDYLLHNSPKEISVNSSAYIDVQIISNEFPKQVEAIFLENGKIENIAMNKSKLGFYSVKIPQKYTAKTGVIRYHISYKIGEEFRSYPGGEKETYLLDRRIYSDDLSIDFNKPYTVNVVEPNNAIVLFNVSEHWEQLIKMNRKDKYRILPSNKPNSLKMELSFPKKRYSFDDYALRFYCRDKILNRIKDLKSKSLISLCAKSINSNATDVEVVLIQSNGEAYSTILKIESKEKVYSCNLKDLKLSEQILLPRPYPKFQTYKSKIGSVENFNLDMVESVQININKNQIENNQKLEISWISIN